LTLGRRTLVMGIVNVTPDSFSDGGQAYRRHDAIDRALRLVDEGADIIDIGGESTRPGSEPLSLEAELERVIPVIDGLQGKIKVPISIDTHKSKVAAAAVEAGAEIINDISAGNFDPEMRKVAADTGVGVVLMHIKGTPRDMQQNPAYEDVVSEIKDYLEAAVGVFELVGVPREKILVDPGIGFGKNLEHNLMLIRYLKEFQGIAAGVLVGPSRKSFLGMLTGRPVEDRLAGTIAAVTLCAINKADVVRVHDVKPVVDALKVADAVVRNGD
jgi:dihydropteroate synthase